MKELFRKTSLINNVRRESRPIGGGGSREVFVNDGPGVKAVETAMHKPVRQTPILEAARQTRAPVQLTKRDTRAPNTQAPATPHAATPPASPQPKIDMSPQPKRPSATVPGTQSGRSEDHARINRAPVTPPAPTPQNRPQPNLPPAPAPSSHTAPSLPKPVQHYYSPKDQYSHSAVQRSSPAPAPRSISPQPQPHSQPGPQRSEQEDRHEEKR